ncbi:hypothetical protein D3C80_1499400 [compost metagenome]
MALLLDPNFTLLSALMSFRNFLTLSLFALLRPDAISGKNKTLKFPFLHLQFLNLIKRVAVADEVESVEEDILYVNVND